MRRNGFRIVRSTAKIALLVCFLEVMSGKFFAQEGVDIPAPRAVSATQQAAPEKQPADRLSRIEEQLRKLEARNQQLQKNYDSLKKEHDKILNKEKSSVFGADAKNPDGMGIPGGIQLGPDAPATSADGQKGGGEQADGGEEGEEGFPAGFIRGSRRVGGGPSGATATRPPLYWFGPFFFRDNTAEIAGREAYRPNMPAMEHMVGPNAFLGGPENGMTWQSSDKYFSLTFHNLTQLDLREPFQQGDPLHGGFIIPRQRWYFEGKVGDYATFVTSINRGYSAEDLLDSYVDFIVHPEWLSFRVGRMKTPSQYEYISIDEANLIGPERSIWVQNFAGNRQLGAMAHGRLFDRRIEYFAGAFNGQRRSFEDFNSSRDWFFYLDYRPFIQTGVEWLEGLHMVGTYNFGEQRNPLSPIALRTFNQLSNSDAAAFVSPTILEFNNAVFENGPRGFYSYETVYYYKSWGFLGGIQGGYQDYSVQAAAGAKALTPNSAPPAATAVTSPFASTRQNANNEFLGVDSPFRTHVPTVGWSFQTWCFLTGEEITRRRYLVEPRNPYGYYNGYVHPGAIELFAKVSDLQIGTSAFRGGIVNQALWTNSAFAPEIGCNWYLNHFVKFTFDYQHVFLGGPVILDPTNNKFTKAYDMVTFRTQLFF